MCVYSVYMARLNVYLPDDLAERARAAGLNVSAAAQEAVAAELDRQALREWLDAEPPGSGVVTHDEVLAALAAGRPDAS